MKATFFITYIMLDGWAGVAAEILRLVPLVKYHLKNSFLVKTEKDREEAMNPGCIEFNVCEPKLQLYFLLGLVYATVTPFLLPFITVFFVFAYVVYRHQVQFGSFFSLYIFFIQVLKLLLICYILCVCVQIINVYNSKYESAAAYWPDVHRRIIIAMIISQILLMGLMSTKKATYSTPLLLFLPVLTIYFNIFCNGRFESAFTKYPLQVCMIIFFEPKISN